MMQTSFDFLVELPETNLEQHQLRSHNRNGTPSQTPSLYEVRMQDDGGVTAIRGFEYQHHFTVSKYLLLVNCPNEFAFVSSETHNDVVVKRINGSYEFYQVKTRSENQACTWQTAIRLSVTKDNLSLYE